MTDQWEGTVLTCEQVNIADYEGMRGLAEAYVGKLSDITSFHKRCVL
ncbi:MAG: hypothetical protein LIO92_07980 [Clostridiales bacterium]|nr:hypothetical protein [Clostridiales bacterium]